MLSRQGVLGQGEFRQRLDNGFYNICACPASSQTTPSPSCRARSAPASATSAARSNRRAGSTSTTRWRTGWDLVGVTDKWFLDNYRIRNQNITTDYFREATSTAYLIGQGDRSWFEVRGYYFKGLSSFDWQKQQPIVAPVIDYDKRINGPSEIGGEVRFQANITSLTRETTQFQGLPRTSSYLFSPSVNGVSFPLYETCTIFQRGTCLVRGLAGTNTRASAELSWRRSFIDDSGQKFTPFAYLRTDAFFTNPSFSGYQNDLAPQVAKIDDGFAGRVMPAVGLDYRYPFVANFGAARRPHPGADRPDHRPPVRDPDRPPAERGRAEPRLRRHLAVRVGQVLRLRPGRGRRAHQSRRPVLGGDAVGLVRQRAVRRVHPARGRQLVPPRRHRQCRPRIPAWRPQRSDFVGRVPGLAEPEHHVHHPRAVRPGRLPGRRGSRPAPRRGSRRSCRSPLSAFYSYYEAQPLLGFSHYREGITGHRDLQHHAELPL